MTTGEYLVSESSLETGTAEEHLLNIEGEGAGFTVIAKSVEIEELEPIEVQTESTVEIQIDDSIEIKEETDTKIREELDVYIQETHC